MAIVTRYFSTTAAGDEDGTSWANRAAFISGGAYSAVITGFDFSGSDSLVCYVEGGKTYTLPANFESASFTTAAPTLLNGLYIRPCDSSGDALADPDPGWKSPQKMWPAINMPLFDHGNSYRFTLDCLHLYLTDHTGSRNGNVVDLYANGSAFRCRFKNTGSGTSGCALYTVGRVDSCWVECTDGYAAVLTSTSPDVFNIRIQGAGIGVGSGNRNGWNHTFLVQFINNTVVGCNGAAIEMITTSTSREGSLIGNTIANNGGAGIDLDLTSGTASGMCFVTRNYISGNLVGVDLNSNMNAFVAGNRLRDNTSGNVANTRNEPIDIGNYTTDSDDATEFVDSTNGDYRIKASSEIWGKGYGAGDGPPTGGSATVAKETTVKDAGDASIKMTGPGRYLLQIPVDATSTTVKVKVRRDSTTYDLGTRPSVILIDKYGDANISGDTETETGSASCDDAWEELTFTAFTPSAKTVVFLELVSQTTASDGICYFDTVTVT